MKLFVWDDESTLVDYGHGLIVALAPDLESALKAIDEAGVWSGGFAAHAPTHVINISKAKPVAFYCYGSG